MYSPADGPRLTDMIRMIQESTEPGDLPLFGEWRYLKSITQNINESRQKSSDYISVQCVSVAVENSVGTFPLRQGQYQKVRVVVVI